MITKVKVRKDSPLRNCIEIETENGRLFMTDKFINILWEAGQMQYGEIIPKEHIHFVDKDIFDFAQIRREQVKQAIKEIGG